MDVRDRVSSVFKGPEEFDLTSGGIGKPLFFLSLPIVVTNLFQTAYNLADTFWLDQYSTDALTAISFAFPMVFLLISLGMGISVAGSVLVAQYTGAGIVVWFAAAPLADVFTTDPGVVEIAAQFLRYVALTFGFIGVVRAYTGSFRGAGKTLTAAAISVLMLAVVRFPIAWVLANSMRETGIWFVFAVSNVVGAVVAYAWYRRGTWHDSDHTESTVDVEESGLAAVSTDD